MATVTTISAPQTNIEYSILDGRIRSFEFKGRLLYDKASGMAVDGWKDSLVSFVKNTKLNVNRGIGLNAFVYNLIDEGFIKEERI